MEPSSLVMDFSSLATDRMIEELKCTICNNYLSNFPIYSSPNGQNVCGRCSIYSNNYIRNKIYEIVSQKTSFPCRYKSEGCCEILLPNYIPQHEKLCPYRTRECPIQDLTECDVTLSYPDMNKHCREEHSEYLLKDASFEIDTTKSQQYDYLLEHENKFFRLTSEFKHKEKLFILIIPRSIVEFICGGRKLSVECNTHTISGNKKHKISLNALIRSKKSTVSATIYLFPKMRSSTISNKQLLNLWKCSSCSKYVLPLNLSSNMVCPKCRNRFYVNDTALYTTIDQISALVTFPCGNCSNGCKFTGKSAEIAGHEEFCPFGSQTCPLRDYITCDWSGLGKNVKFHILQEHSSTFVKLSNIREKISSELIKCYMLKYSHYLFNLIFLCRNQKFYWVLEMMGEFEAGFKYEIELNPPCTSPKISITQNCSKQRRKHELVQTLHNYCYISLDQINNYYPASGIQEINFKVRIFKHFNNQHGFSFIMK